MFQFYCRHVFPVVLWARHNSLQDKANNNLLLLLLLLYRYGAF